MDSFALVYFEDEKRYSAVAVASLKGGSENLNKGSEVIVLGSYFDPVTNAPIEMLSGLPSLLNLVRTDSFVSLELKQSSVIIDPYSVQPVSTVRQFVRRPHAGTET